MPTRRVIGADLAAKYPDKYPDRVQRVVLGPCMICGSTECRFEEDHVDKAISRPGSRHRSPAATDRRDKALPVPEGFEQDPKDPDTIIAVGEMMIEHYPRGAQRPSTLILFHGGERMTREAYASRLAAYNRVPTETK